jgi:hypothetical protein
MMGTQIGHGQNNLDGNWGFGEGCFGPGGADPLTGDCLDGNPPTALTPGNYLVEVVIPDDASDNPMFIPTREEDLNVFDGDTFIPNIPPPACAGPLHIVDVADAGPDNMAARYHAVEVFNNATGGTFTLTANGGETTGDIPFDAGPFWIEAALEGLLAINNVTVTGTGTDIDPWVITFENPVVGELTADDGGLTPLGSASTIAEALINTITVPASTPTVNPNYAAEYDAGFDRYEGQVMPLCDVKYVPLSNGKAVAPIFNLFTPVPIPGKWKGYLIDNLNVSVDPTKLFYGEMAGIPDVPIGLYDYSGRLVHTAHSDYNGVYEVLMPSTGTFNAPTPSGMTANVYYQYGNDPGPIGQPNLNYNPQYRSIGTSFEIYPGTIIPADLAPEQNGAAIWSPGVLSSLSLCRLNQDPANPTAPEFFAVDTPYLDGSGSFFIYGTGFGATPGVVQLGNISLPVVDWSDRTIEVSVPAGTEQGAHQLTVVTAGGLSTVNGLTFHILGNQYRLNVYEVGPGRTYDPNDPIYDGTGRGPIQHAIDDAWASRGNRGDLVVVYPGAPAPMVNTLGMYLENPVIYAPVTLQGVGPGGGYPDTPSVPGSIIDGRAVGGDSPYNQWWRHTLIPDIWNNRGGWDPAIVDGDGNPIVYEGAVITLFGEDGEFDEGDSATIDGFVIQGGDQQGFPNNIHQVGGLPTGAAANVVVQGGGIFANGYVPFLQISNNHVQTNGGSYGGGIRLGTPHIADLLDPDHNDGIRIVHNRILANGGTNLAGAIALFTGVSNYEIAYNDICGNSSIEYGGGVSHYGLSPGGRIHHNRIYFNSAYDEGGGVMIAGELPADPTVLSPGAGAVDVYNNLIQSNLANDDGGGLRFLMAGNYPYDVYNNMIVNNVSTHEGGGISLNDAPRVNIYNNTIMKNITTATAVTSDGTAAPAGLSSSRHSAVLQATLPRKAPVFSDPRLFNNVFWDNRAGTLTAQGVVGIGDPDDPNPPYNWDLGVGDGSGLLSPEYCLMQTTLGTNPGTGNLVGQDPTVVGAYDSVVRILPWRGNPNFVGADIIVLDQPISLQGDYHLADGSPAIDAGTDRTSAPPAVHAPSTDYDDEPRPSGAGYDIGADEFVPVP